MTVKRHTTGERGQREEPGTRLDEVLESVDIGEARVWKNVQVFPLHKTNGHEPAYALIDDLLEANQAEVTEIDDGGSVPTIKVSNKSERDALILDGLELKGAKQNRMVNLTIIAGKLAETEIPVACVEAGRWAYRSRGFTSAKRTVAGGLRARKAEMVAASLACSAGPAVRQASVWGDVDVYLRRAAALSETSALEDAFVSHEADIDDSIKTLEEMDAHGAVVAVDGEIVSLDLFDAAGTFKKVWPSLLRGHGLDAVLAPREGTKKITRRKVSNWIDRARRNAKAARYQVPGVGEYHSVRGDCLAGGIALHQNEVVHLALFAVQKGEETWDEA